MAKDSWQRQLVYFVGVMVASAVLLKLITDNQALFRYATFCVVEGAPLLPRGAKYSLEMCGEDFQAENCLVTSWHVLHALQYAVLGILAPDFWWLALLLGIGFEIFEMVVGECHDVSDVVFNMVGFGVGAVLNKTLIR